MQLNAMKPKPILTQMELKMPQIPFKLRKKFMPAEQKSSTFQVGFLTCEMPLAIKAMQCNAMQLDSMLD